MVQNSCRAKKMQKRPFRILKCGISEREMHRFRTQSEAFWNEKMSVF